MTDELERLRIQLRDTRKKPVAGDFWQGPTMDDIEAAVQAAIQASRPAGVNLWDVPELEQAIRHACAVARRDALRDVPCGHNWEGDGDCIAAQKLYQRSPDASFPMCERCRLLAEAEEAVRRGA